ncbi:dihydrodipicolinate synthase family protein, partial [Pseudomonas sp. GW456-12-10-14-LB2]|uniref:dihydrodipicolinate synthase family protein n=1 Tax=Pseudomonas sp. GW456-12-10-14-LB2 TaxID=2070674 RepID=UPI000CCA10C7
FDEKGRIDIDSLQSLIDFNVAAGVHGLGVALGSEIFKFSEGERELVTRTVVTHVAGRVPVVINSGASGTDLAVLYSRGAEAAGADALM